MVVPTPQIIYQNWIGKKPEFSGKPEEDAESHLLSTRDWMEAHNFPERDKVRHFHLMLIGEARLWYESLAPLDDDWPALQNKFRCQFSKIGNTPKQLFHENDYEQKTIPIQTKDLSGKVQESKCELTKFYTQR